MSDQYISIGFITRVHGYNGNVLCHVDLDDPMLINNIDALFIRVGNGYVPIFTERFTIQKKNQALAKFEEINSDKDARELVGNELFLPQGVLPDSNKSVDYTGYFVINAKDDSRVGVIEETMDLGGNVLAVVMVNNEEVYIPIHENNIKSVNATKRQLHLEIAEGLLGLNS